MVAVDLILFLTAFVLFFILIYDLFKDYLKHRGKRPIHKTLLFKYFVPLIGIVIWSFVVVSIFAKPVHFNSPKKQIKYGELHHDYNMVHHAYKSLLKSKPVDYELNFNYTQSLYNQVLFADNPAAERVIVRTSRDNRELKQHFNHLITGGNDDERDLGYLFLALNNLNLEEDLTNSKLNLDEIVNTDIPYYHYVNAYYLYRSDFDNHEEDIIYELQKSIEKHEAITESVSVLSSIYYYDSNQWNELNHLMEDEQTSNYVPAYFKRQVYLFQGQFLNYFIFVIQTDLSNAYWIGIIFAFLISITWIIYLRKIDIFDPERWGHIILVFLLSCITIYLVYPYHDLLANWIGYIGAESSLGEFLYEFVSIGIIEEFVKILPVLLLLKFSKAINEPYDYILYASVSALGFACIENFQYINEISLHNINARLIYSAVGHMLFSSVVAYSMMLAKYHFKFKGRHIILFFAGFLGGALVHTFYDFWLIDAWASQFPQMTTLLMIIGIHAWFVMKNNALNISQFFTPQMQLKNEQIKYFLLISIITIFMGSYVVNSFTLGPDFGWMVLTRDFTAYAFFILYLAFSFSRFEFVRGYMKPFTIPYSVLIPRFKPEPIENGETIYFYSANYRKKPNKPNKMDSLMPVKGVVKEEILIDGKPDFYVVDIDKSLGYEKYNSVQIIIYSKHQKKRFNKNGKSLVNVMVAFKDVDLESTELVKSNFRFVGAVVVVYKA